LRSLKWSSLSARTEKASGCDIEDVEPEDDEIKKPRSNEDAPLEPILGSYSITCHQANPIPLPDQRFASLSFNRGKIGSTKN
jgi:hypothetical protein